MKTQIIGKAWTPKAPCTIVIVKNESYLKSLQLLSDDVAEEKLRTIFFPVDNDNLFEAHPETDVINYYPNRLINQPYGYDYGEAMLNVARMRPEIVITEHTENYLTLKTGTLFGIHYDRNVTPITDKNSMYPVDTMVRFTSGGFGFSFAIAVEANTIEESIRSLHSQVQPEVQELLSKNLQLAYMDGKRWEITEDQILSALEN